MFDSNLKYKGDYIWIIKLIESHPNKKYIDYVLSNNRIHPDQTTNKMRNQISEEQVIIRRGYQSSKSIYSIAKTIKNCRSAFIRILYKSKTEGFGAGVSLFMSFFRDKLKKK
jgi:hypothetical protein